MAMLKPLSGSQCEAVIECARSNRVDKRLLHWKNDGYKDQNPSHTRDFVTFPKQEFKFDIGGNAMKVEPIIPKLQYHPKRTNHNFLKLPILIKDTNKDNIGWVDIAEKQDQTEKQPDYDYLEKIFLHLFPFNVQSSVNTEDETMLKGKNSS